MYMNMLTYVVVNVLVAVLYTTIGTAFVLGACGYGPVIVAVGLLAFQVWHFNVSTLKNYQVALSWSK